MDISPEGVLELGDGPHSEIGFDADVLVQAEDTVIVAQGLNWMVGLDCVLDGIDEVLDFIVGACEDESSEVVLGPRIEKFLGASDELRQR